jgi:cellulose synthase/poly-beta-1,6-N-acetylglucosamine synthase-like glycosyltransferase
MFEYLFWLSATLVVYGTIGYPALILVLSKLAPKPIRKADILPTVTCVIAARDEAKRIGAKLENLLVSNYPLNRFDIIVVSDGSTDNTEAAVMEWARGSSAYCTGYEVGALAAGSVVS